MNKLKIGVLGCANIAKRSMIPAILQCDHFELVAIASRDIQKATKIAKQFNIPFTESYESLIEREDLDALYIPLPIGLHKKWVLKGLRNQKHIICEKSLTANYKDTKEIVDYAKANKLLVIENFMFTHHTQHEYVKNVVASGEIGELRCFRSSFGFPPFKDVDNIRYQKELGGGALLDAGAYTIKAAQFFLGYDLEVSAANLYIDREKDIDLWGTASLKHSNGIGIQLAFGFDNFYQCNYELWGSKGKLIAHRSFTAGPNISPVITIAYQGKKVEINLPKDNHFLNILDDFAKAILSKEYEKYYTELLNQSRLLNKILQYEKR